MLYDQEKIKTGRNGFMNLWLPKDKTFTATINYQDKTVEIPLSSNKQSYTCVTTPKLI